MRKKIILRFRDLVTEDDGTINDHQALINNYGEVWWGWWMKQKEYPPRRIFKEIGIDIKELGNIVGFLFNTGLHKLYKISVKKILLAPENITISTPDPKISPTYYHRGTYPAWFLIDKIEEVDFGSYNFSYHSFPTKSEEYESFSGKKITSLDEMEKQNVTLWLVNSEKE